MRRPGRRLGLAAEQLLRRSLGIVGMGKARQRLRIERALVLRRCNAHSGEQQGDREVRGGVRIDSTSLGSHVGSEKYAIRYESFPNENFARGLRATPPFWSQSPSRRTGRRASSAKRFERAPRPASGARVATANVGMRQVLSDQHVANVHDLQIDISAELDRLPEPRGGPGCQHPLKAAVSTAPKLGGVKIDEADSGPPLSREPIAKLGWRGELLGFEG